MNINGVNQMKTRYYQTVEGFIYSWTGYNAPAGVDHLTKLHHSTGRRLYAAQCRNLAH
jgi:hypothetical protein